MNEIILSKQFIEWLYALKDIQARRKILQRIDRAKNNNFGDYKQLTENLYEMRIFTGPGYRVYYTKRGNKIYIVLVGGDKSSQSKDIEFALEMLHEMGADYD